MSLIDDTNNNKSVVRVIGFGGRVPLLVCELIVSGVRNGCIRSVTQEGSTAMELALLGPPYRISTTSTSSMEEEEQDCTITTCLYLYCLPSSTSEYILSGLEGTNRIRSRIYSNLIHSNNYALVACFNPITNTLLGCTNQDIMDVLSPNNNKNNNITRNNLNSIALDHFASLDKDVALQLMPQQQQHTVLLIGSGGREHAMALALAKSPRVASVLCYPGNAGTATEGGKISNVKSSSNNTTTNHHIATLVQQLHIHMVAIGPEGPLVDGLVDYLAIHCPTVRAFGPTKAAAQLEASKAFSKDFLQEHDIPTAAYRNFTDATEAIAYVEMLFDEDTTTRVVVKASGLAAGKGVLLPITLEETIDAIREIMESCKFGPEAGQVCVIESFLEGPEASCLAFCDGTTARLMPAAQDHKRALDHDLGLNTGGMGAYCPAPCVSPALHQQIEEYCIQTVQHMAKRGTPYVGILYAGMLLTRNGPYVLEFNCRFGDPETQVLLPLLENDLYEVMVACCDGTLHTMDIRFKENTTATTVVCAAKGYPDAYPTNMSIVGLDRVAQLYNKNVKVYHAGTKLALDGTSSSSYLCNGGRVLAVTGIGRTISESRKAAYDAVHTIDFVATGNIESLMHYRNDIAKRATGTNKKLRIGVLGSTRGTSLVPVMEACAMGTLNANIVAVLSNKSTAAILDMGISIGPTCITKFVSSKSLTREEHDAEVTSILRSAGVDVVLLIGYMRIISKAFTDCWSGRCLNVHPSLLPKHAGGMDLAVHQEVIDAGETETGCTIHLVTEDVDGGPIVVQKVVSVTESDTADSLKDKVQILEGVAFIEAIQKLYGDGSGIISYADAGVSIDSGNSLVEQIKPACKSTIRPGCDAELGGFGGLFDLAAAGYDSANTILIGATDGVGTKLRVAQDMNKHETVGIDLVAMCVNDLIVAGGEPLFFLDYYATGKLEVDVAAEVVRGIAEGCRQSHCGLIGGETAEMPSMYKPGDYDLAGFSVGAVHRDYILPRNVAVGNILLGLPSSGIHSNGFSLVRKLVAKENFTFHTSPCPWDDSPTIGDSLLTPTKIYVKCCMPLLKARCINAMSHITGGGLLENLPRSLPKGIIAEISGHPPLSPVFAWMKKASGLDDHEMLRTFNCGIGMVLIVSKENVDEAKSLLKQAGEDVVYDLGVLVAGDGEQCQMKHRLE